MKTASCLAAILFAGMALTTRSLASSPYGPDINAPSDDDPASLTPARDVDSSDAPSDGKDQDKDKDWLLRNFEKVLSSSTSPSGEKNTNIYFQIRDNKDLSKLAGFTSTDPDQDTSQQASDQAASLRTGVTGPGAPTLRLDPSTQRSAAPLPLLSTLKPLISPMGAADVAGLHNFYAPLDLSGAGPKPAPVQTMDRGNGDSTALDTPGMTAIEDDPAMDKVPTDLSFDISSDGSLDKGPSADSEGKDALPLSTNLERLQKQDATALNVPGTEAKTAQATPTPINPVQIKLPADLEPAKMIPQSPVHPAIADPHDIFYK